MSVILDPRHLINDKKNIMSIIYIQIFSWCHRKKPFFSELKHSGMKICKMPSIIIANRSRMSPEFLQFLKGAYEFQNCSKKIADSGICQNRLSQFCYGGETGIRTRGGSFPPHSLSRRAPSAGSAISPGFWWIKIALAGGNWLSDVFWIFWRRE